MKEGGASATAPPSLGARWVAGARRRWPELVFALLSLVVLVWVAQAALVVRVATFSSSSDYWEHAAALRALIEDPLRPANPQLVSDASSPRFGPHFVLIALVARAFGLDAFGAMGLAALVNVALFLAGIGYFLRTYFDERLAPLFGLVVFLGSWLDPPHFSNVYQLAVLFSVASYPSTAALGISWLGFALTLRALRSARARSTECALLVVLWAYVFATHQLTAAFGLSGALLLALTEKVPRRTRALFVALPFLGVGLAALWPYYSTLAVIVQGTTENVSQNLAGGPADRPGRFLGSRSLFDVVGVATVGLLAFPHFVRSRSHPFLVLGFAATASITALAEYVPLPLGHRFLLFAVFYLQAATVWVLLFLTGEVRGRGLLSSRRTRLGGWALAACLLAYCTFPNVSRARERLIDRPEESQPAAFARRVARLAGPGAVVLATRKTSWALPAYGPKVVVLHHENPLVYDANARMQHVRAFYSPDTLDSVRADILQKYGVTAVIVGPNSSFLEPFLRRRGERRRLPQGHALYVL